MREIIVGIDPGAKGAACVLRGGNRYLLPVNPPDELIRLLRDNAHRDIIVAIEEVHAVFGSSAKATFAFGHAVGLLHGILTALQIPYVLVPPKKWQREIWTATDNTGDTKATSLNAARRLFPTMDFRRTPNCKKPDDNFIDATLICEYARRKNL